MFEAVAAFFGVMSAGIFIAHAVDDWCRFNDTGSVDVPTVFRTWEQACDAAREAVASVADLDTMSKGRKGHEGEKFSMRWILSHMVEEYARHNGHADLLRERLDGATGAD